MLNAMHAAGLAPADTINLTDDGKLHRFTVQGDRPKSCNGWYVLYGGDSFQAGRFGSWKTDENHPWCSKEKSEFTAEQKAAYRSKMEAIRRARDAEAERVHAECREWCTEKWPTLPLAETHPYLTRKGVHAHGLRMMGTTLVVPVMDLQGGLHGVQFISPDGEKKFKSGTDYMGKFHLIGKPNGTLLICEGYASGATLYEATGVAVLAAFTAGNLKAVAEYVHQHRPKIKLIICGDNDAWHKNPDGTRTPTPCTINGRKYDNIGESKAKAAALSVRGEYRIPQFQDTSSYPTDFNDLAALEGLPAVNRQIFPPPVAEYIPPPTDDDGPPPEPLDPEEYQEHPLQAAPFQLLGYDHGEYYYLPRGAPQVKSLTADKHSPAHMIALAPLNWWEGAFPAKTGFNEMQAKNMLIRAQETVGVYDNRRVRGRGAWVEKDQPVLHLGDRLIVAGKLKALSDHKSYWIYEAGSRLEMDGLNTDPMLNSDAFKLLELCRRFSWERPIYAELLAGWMVIAPLCGVMPWRPHILITGAAGSGKSTVSDSVVRPVVGPAAITCMGNTTEAGLRGEAGSDARPVLFDEAESGGEATKRMQAVLELARQSSSDIGYSILKGSQSGKSVRYQPRMCFCFSSIGAAATQQADNERITALSLRRDDKLGHVERYEETKRQICELLTNDYCQALRARGYSLIPTILGNYRVFSRLLAIKFHSQRAGDQMGALLSGTFSLRSRNLVDEKTAQEYIDTLDWTSDNVDVANRDEVQCLGVILQHQIRVTPTDSLTVGELLETSSVATNIKCGESRAVLLRHGIKVTYQGDGFYIANRHTAIAAILRTSPWSLNWGHILSRLPGAIKTKPVNFTAGAYSRSVLLPMGVLESGVFG